MNDETINEINEILDAREEVFKRKGSPPAQGNRSHGQWFEERQAYKQGVMNVDIATGLSLLRLLEKQRKNNETH